MTRERELGGGTAALLVGTMIGAMVAARFETAIGCAALAIVMARAAGGRLPDRRWLWALAGGALLAIVLNLYLTPGRRIAALSPGGLTATIEGLRFGSLLALRLIGATAALQGLRAAWPGERAADEIARLLGPLERWRVPVGEARLMIGLATRFMPIVQEEGGRIARLQALRLGGQARGLGQRIDRLRATMIPALVSAVERAERTAIALEARHYRVREAPPGLAGSARGWIASAAVVVFALSWR